MECSPEKLKKRRDNILYRLRRKDVRCDTYARTVYYPYGKNPEEVVQIRRLRKEFGFVVQFEI